jgi:hypothetical protein
MLRETTKTARRRGAAGAIALAAVTSTMSEARAWYFPEHAEETRLALVQYLPYTAVEAIQSAVDDARRCIADDSPGAKKDACKRFSGLPICPDIGLPFAGTSLASSVDGAAKYPELAWLTTEYATCIPFGALSALAADHAVNAEELAKLITEPQPRPEMQSLTVGGMVTGAGVMAWREFLAAAPLEFTRAFETRTPNGPGSPLLTTTMNRRKLTRDLDARLQLVDHDYVTRAAGSKSHFQNAEKTMSEIVSELKTVGNTDNALAQMLAHHLRSMALAIRAQPPAGRDKEMVPPSQEITNKRRLWRSEALLEHVLAVHFMQDAFSSGHMATEHALNDSTDRLQRHDYLCHHGLAAHRVLAQRSCPSIGPDGELDRGDLPYCWTAYGDGYLDIDNIPYVAEATARLQVQFALALDGSDSWETKIFGEPVVGREGECLFTPNDLRKHPVQHNICLAGEGRREQATKAIQRLASLLDPTPSWSYPAPGRTAGAQGTDSRPRHEHDLRKQIKIVSSAFEAVRALKSEIDALAARQPPMPLDSISCGAGDGAQTSAAELARELLGEPFRPCMADGDKSDMVRSDLGTDDDAQDPACDPHHHIRISYDVRLWRPLLVAWPGAQADVRTLEGRDSFGRGLAFQIGYGANGTWVIGSNNAGVFGLGGTVGLAYRADSLLPGRDNRAIVELNAGFAPTLVVGLPTTTTNSTTYATIAFAEVRAPVLPLLTLLAGYVTRSADAVDPVRIPAGIGIYGARTYVLVPATGSGVSAFKELGWDLEVAYVALGRDAIGRTASAGVAVAPELRLRIGSSPIVDRVTASICGLDNTACRSSSGRQVTLGLELAGGFSWFL